VLGKKHSEPFKRRSATNWINTHDKSLIMKSRLGLYPRCSYIKHILLPIYHVLISMYCDGKRTRNGRCRAIKWL